MANYLIIGAGAVGSEIARQLLDQGDQVTVATRSGTQLPGAKSVIAQASDTEALTSAMHGMDAVMVCTNPPYHRWREEWPPIARAVIEAAEKTNTAVLWMGNLYSYGIPHGAMTANTPFAPEDSKGQVRAELSEQLFQAHREGRIQATEIRASDYFGPSAAQNTHVGPRFMLPLIQGRTAHVLGNPKLRHSWAYLPDIAATFLAALKNPDVAYGRPWIAPHTNDVDRITFARRISELTGKPVGKVKPYSLALMRVISPFSPEIRELVASSYQFTHEYIADSSETEQLLGVKATDFDEAVRASLAALPSRA